MRGGSAKKAYLFTTIASAGSYPAELCQEAFVRIRPSPVQASSALYAPSVLGQLWLLQPEDEEKLLEDVCPTTCSLDPCPSWFLKASWRELTGWVLGVTDASLEKKGVPSAFKDPEALNNYCLPFVAKCSRWWWSSFRHAWRNLNIWLHLSAFRPGHGPETALLDGIYQERDVGNLTLISLTFWLLLIPFDHSIQSAVAQGGADWEHVIQWFHSNL